jgi:hypothetical protein
MAVAACHLHRRYPAETLEFELTRAIAACNEFMIFDMPRIESCSERFGRNCDLEAFKKVVRSSYL